MCTVIFLANLQTGEDGCLKQNDKNLNTEKSSFHAEKINKNLMEKKGPVGGKGRG